MSVDLGALYAAARGRITGVLDGAGPEVGSVPCPATPGWTVHDVNLSGLRIDKANLAGSSIVNGRMAGMTIDGLEVTELLACWHEHHPVAESKTA